MFFPCFCFFLSFVNDNQILCGKLQKILVVRAGDQELILRYDWPNELNDCKEIFSKTAKICLYK